MFRPSHTPVLTGREQQCPPWHDHKASPQSASWTQVTALSLTSFIFSLLGHTAREPVKKKIMRFLLPPQVYRKSCNQNQLIDPLTWLGTAVAIITKVGSLSWSLTLNILHAEFRLLCLIQQQSSIVGAHSYKRGLKAMTWFMCKRAAKHRENFPLSEWQIER